MLVPGLWSFTNRFSSHSIVVVHFLTRRTIMAELSLSIIISCYNQIPLALELALEEFRTSMGSDDSDPSSIVGLTASNSSRRFS
jgi:hypothetical protein